MLMLSRIGLAAIALLPVAAQAQDLAAVYKDKEITFIVGSDPGGG